MGGVEPRDDHDVGLERPLRRFAVIAAAAFLVLAGSDARAQELDSGAREVQFFVPRLGGAVSLDASVAYRFHIGNEDPLPVNTFGGALGYRHFFDWHGKLSLRGWGALRYGPLNTSVNGDVWQYGGGLSLHARDYTKRWGFGGVGVYTELLATAWNQPQVGLGSEPERLRGYQASAGLEADFGQLLFADPYLFAESSALFGINYINVGPWSSWSIDARWVLRFDWAWRPSVGDQE